MFTEYLLCQALCFISPFMEFSHNFSVTFWEISIPVVETTPASCLGSPMDSSLQRLKFINIINLPLKLPNRIRIHTQVCLTQNMVIPLHTMFPELSEGLWPLIWPEIPTRANTPQTFSPSTFDDVLQICRSSGRFILGRSELCLFPFCTSSSAPNYMTSRPLSKGTHFILTLDRARECNGWNYEPTGLETVFLRGRR